MKRRSAAFVLVGISILVAAFAATPVRGIFQSPSAARSDARDSHGRRAGDADVDPQSDFGGSFWLGIGVTGIVKAARAFGFFVRVVTDVFATLAAKRRSTIRPGRAPRGETRAASAAPSPLASAFDRRFPMVSDRRRIVAAAVSSALIFFARPGDAATVPDAGTIVVSVATLDGAPIDRASVRLSRGAGTRAFVVASDGTVAIPGIRPGTYALSAEAPGFAPLAPQPLAVTAGMSTTIRLALARSTTSLTTIGRVTTGGTTAISTSSAPIQTLRSQEYAARGYTRLSDVLADALSTTVIRAGTGSAAAPQTVALRGPDPTETLVDIDGHELNNSLNGGFDLSLLDPADFEGVQLVYGIAPSALIGPSTIGGAINVRTLEPTTKPLALVRISAGSDDAFARTLQATGTADRFGYAFSLHETRTANDVSNQTVTNANGDASIVGSDVSAKTALAKVRYAFGRDRAAYAEVTVRDQSVTRDVSAGLTSLNSDGTYAVSDGSRLQDTNVGYGFDIQLPLQIDRSTGLAKTSAIFRHLTSLARQSVEGAAAGTNSTYFDDRDLIADDTLEFDRTGATSGFALKFRLRGERLDTFDPTLAGSVADQSVASHPLSRSSTAAADASVAAPPHTVAGLMQSQASIALRFTADPTPHLHYTAAAYYSNFSIFGSSLDPRLGIVWTPTPMTAVRASAGSTFQAPQLSELYVPATLPQPDSNGRISIGNPSLRADHATEYDLGYEHLIGTGARPLRASVDVYRTNLRTPAQRFVPATTCDPGAPSLACASYPINIGNAVYTGAEFHLERNLDAHTVVRLGYGIDSAYPVNAPAAVQNGSIVAREQFLGVPLHKATLSLDHRSETGLSYDAALLYEGAYNELNRGPFATLRATVGYTLGNFELSATGTNLTNVYAARFTQAGGGVPYGGSEGPVPTDAYALPRRAVSVALTRRL